MSQGANIYLDEGATGPNVTVTDGVAGHETEVLTYSPDRGTAIRILNAVAAGSSAGIPVQMKLKDSNGNLLPTNTTVYLAVKRAGQSAFHRISEEVVGIGHWNRTGLTKQMNVDQIDQSKIELQYPEASGKEGSPQSVKVRHIDEFAFVVDSSVALDTAKSTVQLDTDALEGPFSH
ncbi:MAG: hypothetical protein ABEJ85_04965 [Haloarculaceae archaeon]